MDLVQNNYADCPADVALMGLDLGSKTIGVSLSDSGQGIAFPLCTLKRTKFSRDLKALEEIIRDYNIGGYVLGYPLNMDGSAGPRCQSVRDFGLEFAAQLSAELKGQSVWIGLWDERLSTSVVEDFVDKSVNISKRRAKDTGLIDKLAAQHILQGALDFLDSRR